MKVLFCIAYKDHVKTSHLFSAEVRIIHNIVFNVLFQTTQIKIKRYKIEKTYLFLNNNFISISWTINLYNTHIYK